MLQACACAVRIAAGGATIDLMPCRRSSADPCPQHGKRLGHCTPVWLDFCAQSITAYYCRCKHGAVLVQATSAAASVSSQKTGGNNQALESLPQVNWSSLVLVQMWFISFFPSAQMLDPGRRSRMLRKSEKQGNVHR